MGRRRGGPTRAPAVPSGAIETDTDRDGKVDKWEQFDPPGKPGGPPILRVVSLDPGNTGKTTLRLHYRADGTFERTEKPPLEPRTL